MDDEGRRGSPTTVVDLRIQWEPEALRRVQELETNCRDFIYGASEYLADQTGKSLVGLDEVATVLEFIASRRESA